ncbi:hypothetical protein [Streptomyces sp. NPDC050528]|uniref:hypothetical protein n=1 Tax=unclassified Streptomyces TaxID=2593676 RepID=UPI00378C6A8E
MEQPSPSDIAAMLTDQTSACEAARDAVAAGGEVVVLDREVPQWMVAGIAWRRLATCSGVNRSRNPGTKEPPDPAQPR